MKIENSQPQIDYTKVNKDIANYVVNSARAVFKIFPETSKAESEKAFIEIKEHFTKLFSIKFGADVLYNSFIYANFIVMVDGIELQMENKRLRKLIDKKPPKT